MTVTERSAAQRLFEEKIEVTVVAAVVVDETLLVTQKKAAEMLGGRCVTIWRMTKECILRPVEILPGSWRWRFRDLVELTYTGN